MKSQSRLDLFVGDVLRGTKVANDQKKFGWKG